MDSEPKSGVDFGSFTRIGHVNPAAVVDTIALFCDRISPPGVLWVHSCLSIEELNTESFERNLAGIDQSVQHLARAGAQFIIVGGSPVVRWKGTGFHRELMDRMETLTGVPTPTTQRAAIDALQHLGVRRLVAATPYETAVNERTQAFLGESGFTVLGVKGLGLRKAVDMSNVLPEASYRLAREVVEENPGAEAIYFPCARWPVIDNIARLEADLGIPVVTSVQSMLWAALKGLEWREPVAGYGRLLEGLSRNGPHRA